MSSSYKLLYQDRRQFIFEETDETHSTAILTLIAGFIGGSLLGVYFASLDLTTAGSILLAIGTYITVITSLFSLKTNPLSVVAMFITSFTAVIALIYVSRITLDYFKESLFHMVLVFAGLFAIIAEIIYLWSRMTWVEDSRMHQLIESNRDETSTNRYKYETSLWSFFRWILETIRFAISHAYYRLLGDLETASRYPVLFIEPWARWGEAHKSKAITVKNDTLKRVKICVYHRSDYCCWVPVGGITGGMYELDRGEEIVISPHWPSGAFRVKIFAHGMIDFELAAHPCVQRGRSYTFTDVGKPITILPMPMSPPASVHHSLLLTPGSSDDDHEEDDANVSGGDIHADDSSEDGPRIYIENFGSGNRVGGLRRVPSSRANLSRAGSAPSSPQGMMGGNQQPPSTMASPTSVRRQFRLQMSLLMDSGLRESISVLNESTTDIRVNFYSIEDRSFVIALDTFKVTRISPGARVLGTTDSNTIGRGEWKIFEYGGETMRQKFCMRVKSITPGGGSSARLMTSSSQMSIELSYCTAFLGDVLVVRDPLLNLS